MYIHIPYICITYLYIHTYTHTHTHTHTPGAVEENIVLDRGLRGLGLHVGLFSFYYFFSFSVYAY